jgi:hypothetical protein
LPEQNNEKPCLVKSGRGFSVLYRNRFLYSRYDPARSILAAIDSFYILPGTLVLACSPCLGLGLTELSVKLPENCFILGCECDSLLYDFTKEHICQPVEHFALLSPSELSELPALLSKSTAELKDGSILPPPGTFRRVIRIDFSAGTQFTTQYYSMLAQAAENAVGRFWKNRITLTKLGRKYSLNLFRNLSYIPDSVPLEFLAHTVTKTVLVFGAGESMEGTVLKLMHCRTTLYIIAVDAALPALLSSGVVPDAVVCEEAQSVIAPAFFGMQNDNIMIFAGITSWPAIHDLCTGKEKISYFATKYDDTLFFDRLSTEYILPPVIPPLGSVGLTAVYLALILRLNENVPVFVSGLDFSYSSGRTHTRGAPAHTARLCTCIRTIPAADYEAAFGFGSSEADGKNGDTVYTTPILLSYAQTFKYIFSTQKNIFDAGTTGISIGLQQRSISGIAENTNKIEYTTGNSSRTEALDREQLIVRFYDTEEQALRELKDILSHGQNLNESERNKRITVLLTAREYLYLHFPDGYKLSLSPSFLKRIRAEIDFFLKDIHTGKRLLSCHKKHPD